METGRYGVGFPVILLDTSKMKEEHWQCTQTTEFYTVVLAGMVLRCKLVFYQRH